MCKEALPGHLPLGSSSLSHSQAMLESHLSSPVIPRLLHCKRPGSGSGQTTSSHCRSTGWLHAAAEQAGSPLAMAPRQEDTQESFWAAATAGAVRAAGRGSAQGWGWGRGWAASRVLGQLVASLLTDAMPPSPPSVPQPALCAGPCCSPSGSWGLAPFTFLCP